MSNDKLLPCPFCGGTPELEDGRIIWCVRCKCEACVLGACAPEPDGTETDEYWNGIRQTAITAWNRRTPPAASGQPVEPTYCGGNCMGRDVIVVGDGERYCRMAAAHPAPAQQESASTRSERGAIAALELLHEAAKKKGFKSAGDALGVTEEMIQSAPAPAALTDAIAAMERAKKLPVWDSLTGPLHALHVELDVIFKALATASAAPAEQARDAEIETLVAALQDCARHPRKSQRDNIVSKALAAIASQQKGGHEKL